ncbi:MAG: type II CRISPR RNA-guided endonuclease Cas9 [Anaeroplasma sp.]
MSKISLGLDIGTNSVGWAVVDENNQIVKKNGYSLWGVRMFEEAKDASERRSFRSSRRRLKRRKQRINLLREIFMPEMNQVDPTFFERMDDSFYKIEHKKHANIYNLFNDKYTDKDFFNQFPTIYHLRNYLLKSEKKEDIRFIYLALHNMIKYRGNFLSKGDSFDKSNNEQIKDVLINLNNLLVEMSYMFEDYSDYFTQLEISDNLLIEFGKIMISKIGKTNKKLQLKKIFSVPSKSFVVECLIPLLVGSTCNFSKLTPVKDMKYDKCDITLECEDIDALISEKRDLIPEFDQIFNFVPSIKLIIDYYYLVELLGDNDYLCNAMIKKYEEHQSDLKRLKLLIKEYLPSKYNECFRIYNDKVCNYCRYIGMTSVSSKHPTRFSHCKREDFYKYLLSLFNSITDKKATDEINYFKMKIDNNDLLLRQNSDQNGSIPMQLNLIEIKTILNNQAKYYPFIMAENNGITNYDKIISIFKFVIPYYVGPLTTVEKSDKAWMVRKSEGKIYPWNYDQIIDLDKTEIEFVQRMQRKCTYLKGTTDYCLPKNSIVFSKYNCLSYLNKLNINGSLINYDVKMSLFNDVFLKIKKPTKKNILEYLKSNYGNNLISTTKMKDLPEVNCDMSSYIIFKEIFGDVENNLEIIEQIIKDIVIFSDKNRLEKRLIEVYQLDKFIAKKIKDLNYKDFSNLSYKLINGLDIYNPNTGEIYGTLLDVMEKTNLNLQEVLFHPDYRYSDIIDNYNTKFVVEGLSLEEFLNENVAISPTYHRSLVQSFKIIEEIERILNCKIDKYYIECTRTNKKEKNKYSTSRYDNLKELYRKCKNLSFDVDFIELEKELDLNKNNLRSDMIYLYFTQLGRCMYSLEKIDFGTLLQNNNMYDIDHIFPQSLVKDDSMNNKVLVLKKYNNKKQDNMLFELEGFLHPQAYRFYDLLVSKDLISKEKYSRLIKKELNPAELEAFVNRQIVATNQAVKGLITTLKLFKDVKSTDIIYSKAEIVSDVRHYFGWTKSRLANNFHHAHDAYLNVVIGRAINKYYTYNHFNGFIDYYRMKTENKTINPITILEKDRYINNKPIWEKEKMIKLINHNLYERFDIKETTRTYNSNELLYKCKIKPAGNGTVPVSLTDFRADISLYGAFDSYKYCKYVIIKNINSKGKVEYILEAIPKAFENNVDAYLKNIKYNDYEILNYDLRSNIVVRDNELKYCIASRTNDSYNIKNLADRYFSKNEIIIIHKLEKYYNNRSLGYSMPIKDDIIFISPATKKSNGMEINKNETKLLLNSIIEKMSKKVYSYSNITNIYKKMTEWQGDLDIERYVFVCYELLKLLQTNTRQTANLKDIGLSSFSGTLKINKKLKSGMKFISESITGYYNKVLFEVPSE